MTNYLDKETPVITPSAKAGSPLALTIYGALDLCQGSNR